jgi:uncharacterized membrane protein
MLLTSWLWYTYLPNAYFRVTSNLHTCHNPVAAATVLAAAATCCRSSHSVAAAFTAMQRGNCTVVPTSTSVVLAECYR